MSESGAITGLVAILASAPAFAAVFVLVVDWSPYMSRDDRLIRLSVAFGLGLLSIGMFLGIVWISGVDVGALLASIACDFGRAGTTCP